MQSALLRQQRVAASVRGINLPKITFLLWEIFQSQCFGKKYSNQSGEKVLTCYFCEGIYGGLPLIGGFCY